MTFEEWFKEYYLTATPSFKTQLDKSKSLMKDAWEARYQTLTTKDI